MRINMYIYIYIHIPAIIGMLTQDLQNKLEKHKANEKDKGLVAACKVCIGQVELLQNSIFHLSTCVCQTKGTFLVTSHDLGPSQEVNLNLMKSCGGLKIPSQHAHSVQVQSSTSWVSCQNTISIILTTLGNYF